MKKSTAHLRTSLSFAGSFLLHSSILALLLSSIENQLISPPPGTLAAERRPSVHFVNFDERKTGDVIRPSETDGTVTVERTVKRKKRSIQKSAEPNPVRPPESGGSASGVANPGAPNGEDTGPVAEYLWGLRRMIEGRKVYPSLSRRMGEVGKVLVTLEVLRNGAIQEVKLKSGSRFSRLNEAALATVAGVEKYKPLPDAVTEEKLFVEVPIEFSL